MYVCRCLQRLFPSQILCSKSRYLKSDTLHLASQAELELAVLVGNTEVLLNLRGSQRRIESSEPETTSILLLPEPASNIIVVALQASGSSSGLLVVRSLSRPSRLSNPDSSLAVDSLDVLLNIPVRVLEGLEAQRILDGNALPVGEAVGDGNVARLGDHVVAAVDPGSPCVGVADLEVLVELAHHTAHVVDLLGQLVRGDVLAVQVLGTDGNSGDPVGAVLLDDFEKSGLVAAEVSIVGGPDANKDLHASLLGGGILSPSAVIFLRILPSVLMLA
jgi:hypothetical protein